MPFITQNKSNLKYILIVVIAAAIVGGGILAWQYYQGPGEEAKTPEETLQKETAKDKTADWNIYKNIEYGYQIKYPATLEIEGRQGVPVERDNPVGLIFPGSETSGVSRFIMIGVKDKLKGEMGKITGESASSYLWLTGDPKECKMETEESAFARMSCETKDGLTRLISSAFEVDNKFYEITLTITSVALDKELKRGSPPSWKVLPGMDFSYELDVYDQILSTFSVLE